MPQAAIFKNSRFSQKLFKSYKDELNLAFFLI